MSSFEAHSKAISSLLFVTKEGSEHFVVSIGKENELKVWNIAQLLNSDIEAKKPVMIYNSRKEETTCMCNLGNFMSLPILGLGDSAGQVKLAAIAQGTKSREMIIGSWKASHSSPITQIERMEDLSIVATLDKEAVKVWSYTLSDDGLKEELKYSIGSSSLPSFVPHDSSPVVMEWMYPHTELSVIFKGDHAVRLFDINKLAISRSFSLEGLQSRMIDETFGEK